MNSNKNAQRGETYTRGERRRFEGEPRGSYREYPGARLDSSRQNYFCIYARSSEILIVLYNICVYEENLL